MANDLKQSGSKQILRKMRKNIHAMKKKKKQKKKYQTTHPGVNLISNQIIAIVFVINQERNRIAMGNRSLVFDLN